MVGTSNVGAESKCRHEAHEAAITSARWPLQDEYHLYGRYTASNNKNASICYPEYPVDIVGYDAVVSSQNTPPIMPPLNDACTPPASIERSKELSAK